MVVTERPPGPTTGRLAAWLVMVGVLSALSYWARFGVEQANDEPDFLSWTAFYGALIQLTLMLALILWIVRGGPAAELLGLRRPRSWPESVGWILVVLLGTVVVSVALNSLLEPGEEQGFVPEDWDPDRAGPLIANFALTVTYVPVVEELTFRGAGFALLARFGRAAAVVGSAVAFAVAHGILFGLPIIFAVGLGLAWLRERTGSIYPCIALHAFFNGVSIALGMFLDPTEGT